MSTTRPTYDELRDRLTQAENQLAWLQQQRDQAVALAEHRAIQVRALNWELNQVAHRERRNLAQALHDHLQQLLVAARLKLSMLRRHLPGEAARRLQQQIDGLLSEGIAETRSLTARLAPLVLHEAGLAPSLEWLAEDMEQTFGLHVELRLELAAEPAAEDARVLLFQAARELLFNVVKHAQVDTAHLEMRRSDGDLVQMVIRDSGKGFDPRQLAAMSHAGHGFGLTNVCQQLERLGGRVEIDSAPGQGTRIVISAPCQQMPAFRPPHNPSWRLAD